MPVNPTWEPRGRRSCGGGAYGNSMEWKAIALVYEPLGRGVRVSPTCLGVSAGLRLRMGFGVCCKSAHCSVVVFRTTACAGAIPGRVLGLAACRRAGATKEVVGERGAGRMWALAPISNERLRGGFVKDMRVPDMRLPARLDQTFSIPCPPCLHGCLGQSVQLRYARLSPMLSSRCARAMSGRVLHCGQRVLLRGHRWHSGSLRPDLLPQRPGRLDGAGRVGRSRASTGAERAHSPHRRWPKSERAS